jgi:hypothetical protein
MSQQPVSKRRFRDRVVKLWLTITVALACLVVGLGIGVASGFALDSDDRPGRDRFGRPGFPGGGQLPGGGRGGGQVPGGQGGGQLPGQPPAQ